MCETKTPTCPPPERTEGAGDYTGKPPSETTKKKYREKIKQKFKNWVDRFGKENTKGGGNHDNKPPKETIHGR